MEQRYQKITEEEKQRVIDECIAKWTFLKNAKQEGLEKAAGYYLAVKQICDERGYDAISLKDVSFQKNTVITIGNERNGISERVKNVSKTLYIPMSGKSESLNPSVAAGIICWELSIS